MEDQDLDDLFADPLNGPLNEEQIQHQLDNVTPVPPPPGLAERIDQLRLNGCCERIAWSRIGAIAYLSKDRREVRFSNLRFRSGKGEWVKNDYTDVSFPAHIRNMFKGRELAHLSWSNTSLDLLVADVCGRIGLFSIYIAINRVVSTKVITLEQDDSLNALVGLTWLNQKRPIRLSKGARKVDGVWKHLMGNEVLRGSTCPPSAMPGSQKSAFVAVNRKGTIIFGYQPVDQPGWTDIKHDLDGFASSADVLTHAAFCADAGESTLLVVHTASKKLRLYSITIEWPSTKPPGSQHMPPPTISSQHITIIDSCRPATDNHWSVPTPELSKLEIIPRSYLEKGDATHPTIITAFVGSEGVGSTDLTHTAISRWELRESTPTVDSSFSQLSSKRSASNELKHEKSLHRLDDIRIDRVLLQIVFQQYNDTFILSSSDGVAEFRDRRFEILPMEEKPDHVGGIPQLGFALSNGKPCLHTAFSPNSVVKAYMGRDHDLDIAVAQLPAEMVDLGGIATLEKIATAFVGTNAIAESSLPGNSTNDDLIMTLYKFTAQLPDDQQNQLRTMFLKETYKILGMVDKLIDMSQFERAVKSGLIIRCLSIQAALGNFGDQLSRNVPSKIAILALNLRHIWVALVLVVMPKPGAANANGATGPGGVPESEFNRVDVLQFLNHLTTWYLKLTDSVMAGLFTLSRSLDAPHNYDSDALRLRIMASNDPSLLLLCSNFTRALFRQIIRFLRVLAQWTTKPQYAQPPSPTAQYWDACARTFRSAAVSPPLLETLLAELDERAGRAFTEAGLEGAPRAEAELDLLVRGVLPEALLQSGGPVEWLLADALERLRSGSVTVGGTQQTVPVGLEADLAFGDFAILGTGDDQRTRRFRCSVLFDGVQKKPLGMRGPALKVGNGPGELRIRACTRCGIVMEDLLPPRGKDAKAWPGVFHSFRLCVCQAHFVTERAEDLKVPPAAME